MAAAAGVVCAAGAAATIAAAHAGAPTQGRAATPVAAASARLSDAPRGSLAGRQQVAAAAAPIRPAPHTTRTTHTARAATSDSAPSSLPQPVTDVTAYGAVGDGHTDSGAAVRAAMTAAEKVGGTLYFPAGHYLLSAATSGGAFSTPAGGRPLTIAGDSAATSVVTGLTNGAPVLGLRSDHVTVQDLTIDAQSHDLGASIYLIANYNTIQRCSLLGGSHFFGVYAAGDASGVNGNTGNQLLDDTISDRTQMPLGDGISWSYQHNSLIQNIDHTGSRLALYRDTNVTVDGYTYHPGADAQVDQGFWITPQSSGITIDNFTTYGNGGVMSANGGQYTTNVTIDNEVFLGTGGQLRIDGVDGLTISGCSLGTSNSIEFAATVPVHNVVIERCAALPMVRFWDTSSVQVEFDYDTFTPARPSGGGTAATFVSYAGGTGVTFTVTGGIWQNAAGGFATGQMTYTVHGLGNYSGWMETPPDP